MESWSVSIGALSQGYPILSRPVDICDKFAESGPCNANEYYATEYDGRQQLFETISDGRQAYFTQFNVHRTFAQKLDFTGPSDLFELRDSDMSLNEIVSGRDASNNFIDSDIYTAQAIQSGRRPGPIFGITYNVTTKFRISNTFTFDQFAINGGRAFTQDATRRNAAGVPIAPTVATIDCVSVRGVSQDL